MNKNFEVFKKAAEENAELKEKAAELEKKIRNLIDEYIKLAAEYGITLELSDFYPAGGSLTDADLEKVTGGLGAENSGISYFFL